jgi:hypothetical protein
VQQWQQVSGQNAQNAGSTIIPPRPKIATTFGTTTIGIDQRAQHDRVGRYLSLAGQARSWSPPE